MKKLILPLVIVLATLTSCSGKMDSYKITGQIKGLENQQVILEFLTPTELVQIDTAVLDAEGKFTMEGKLKEKGFYRIINNQKFWILLLENTKVNIEADANDPKLRDIKITKYKEGAEFQEAINFLIGKQEEYQAEAQKTQTAMYSPTATDEDRVAAEEVFLTFQKTLMEGIKSKATSFIDNNPFAAVYLLSSLNPQDDKAYIQETIAKLETKLPDNLYVKNIKDVLVKMDEQEKEEQKMAEQAAQVVDGNMPQDIEMANPDGKKMKLSDLKGKVVLVDFWASWCKPCRAENPNVVRIYQMYKDKGFDVFSVSLDKTTEAWKNAIAQDGLVWKNHVSDLKFWDNEAAKAWGVTSIPATFLIGKDGKIIATNLRGAALEAKLKEVL